MGLSVSQEILTETVNWAKYHYGNRLVGLAFFNPAAASMTYPSSPNNLLLVLTDAPETARERYQEIADIVLGVIFGGAENVRCAIQTPDELQSLAELGLPLLKIYLQDCVIAEDPRQLLESLRSGLKKAA
jgi:hypothetical protein